MFKPSIQKGCGIYSFLFLCLDGDEEKTQKLFWTISLKQQMVCFTEPSGRFSPKSARDFWRYKAVVDIWSNVCISILQVNQPTMESKRLTFKDKSPFLEVLDTDSFCWICKDFFLNSGTLQIYRKSMFSPRVVRYSLLYFVLF